MKSRATSLHFRAWTGLVWLMALALLLTLVIATTAVSVRAEGLADVIPSSAAPEGFLPQAGGALTVTKQLVMPSNRNVLLVGETVDFQVVVTNTGTTSIMYMPQLDLFDSVCLQYTSKTAHPIENAYDNSAGTISWDNLIPHVGHNLAPGERYTTTVPFYVNGASVSGFNRAVLNGAVDTDGNTVPQASGQATFTCAVPASLGDLVWDDLDGDGSQDAGEPGLGGVIVRLAASSGLTYTATTSDGSYLIDMLPPDTYTVTVDAATVPSGYVLTTGNLPLVRTLAQNEDYLAADFGYQQQADLAVTKSDNPDPVIAGRTLTYTLVITNNGPAIALNTTLTDTLPAGLTFVSASPTQSSGPNPLVWNVGTLAVGASRTYTVVTTVNSNTTGTLNNTAVVGSSTADPIPGNNTDTEPTTVNTSADLAITKSDTPDPVVAGRTLTYTLSVVNNGPSDAVAVVVTDTLPAGVTHVSTTPSVGSCSGTSNISCNLGTMVRNATATITVVVTVNSGTTGTLTNTTGVTSSTPDPVPGNNFDSEPTTVNTSADLAITKSDTPDPVVAGRTLTYTLSIVNNGPSDAVAVVVTDTLPAGVTHVSTTPSVGSCSGTSNISCNLGTIVRNATATITVVVTVNSGTTGTLTNTTGVTSSTPDPAPGNNFDSEPTTVNVLADLEITKSDSPDPVSVNNPLTYTLVITNNGPSDAVSVSVSDTVPAGVTFVSVGGTGWSCNQAAGLVTCTRGGLAAGGVASITMLVTVNTGTAGPIVNTATVTSSTPDPISSNNTATASTTVLHPALTIAKTPDLQVVYRGTLATFTITVNNISSDADLYNVTVTDVLAPGCDRALGTLTHGNSTSYTCTVTANNDFTNTADVIGTPLGGAPISASDTARVLLYVTVGDRACVDANANNACDDTDFGVRVPLTIRGVDINGLAVEINVTTSITGFYKIDNLVPGTYTVTALSLYNSYQLLSSNTMTGALPIGGSENLDLDFRYILPTSVQVGGFNATARTSEVRLAWRVTLNGQQAPEFHIWRSAGGENWKRLTSVPQGMSAGDAETASYAFSDTAITRGVTYLYRLESATGESFGPWSVRVPAGDEVRRYLPLVGR